jgi:uncharacterized membrane protein
VVLTMRRQFFWLITACVFAFICHVSYVLFLPSRTFSAAIDQALGPDKLNTFTILDTVPQVKLLPFTDPGHLVGICKFNVAKGPVKLTASLPEGFWSLAVYTIRGQQVYAINDTQADTNTFSVEFSRSGGLISQLLASGDEREDVTSDDIGWRISVREQEGLAVLWLALADPLLRQEAESVMKQSRCALVDKPT